jgi:hypothetical protein
MNKIKPVENLHGLSPVENWIQQCQYLEQHLASAVKIIKHYETEHYIPHCNKAREWLAENGYTEREPVNVAETMADLEENIKKATPSWKDVDADEFVNEVRYGGTE